MKLHSQFLACAILFGGIQLGYSVNPNPEFAYTLETKSVSTNRSKFDYREFVPSCGSGPTHFGVYRTYTVQNWLTKASSDAGGSWTATYYTLSRDERRLDGTVTNYSYRHITVQTSFGDCSWTDDNGEVTGDEGCGSGFLDSEPPAGWHDVAICPVDLLTNFPTMHVSSNYCEGTSSGTFYSVAAGAYAVLSDEYTTADLVNLAGADYPDQWNSGGGSASCTISGGNMGGLPVRDYSAASTKLQYRFKVLAPKGQRFKIDYNIWVAYDGESPTNTLASITGIGTGNWAYYPNSPLELLPPYKAITNDGCVDYIGGTRSIELLCGDLVGQGCQASCRPGPGVFDAGLSDSGLTVSMNLGGDAFGEESGSLVLGSAYPTNTLATPAGLSLAGSLNNLEIIPASGNLRQVKSAQVLADIVTLNSTSYEVRFYTSAGSIGGGGLYEPPGAPFAVGKVEQITDANHIRLTVSNGSTRVYDYEWSVADGGWKLTSGGGLRKEIMGWHEASLTRSNTIRNAANDLIFQQTKHYLDLTNYGHVIAKQIAGTGSSALTNLWFYYDNEGADGTNYGSVKMTIEPSGFWKRYQYDQHARLTNEVSQFLNAATNAAENLCRVVRYDYTSLDGTNNCETRIELLQGVEIAREYTVIYPAATHHIRCVTPGASWTNANNLVTITYYQQDIALAGKPQRVISPDGTMQLYQYQEGGAQLTETVLSGQPDGDFTDVTNGTKTVTVMGAAGMITSRATYDIVLGDSYPLESESHSHDSLGRPTTTSYLDGTSTTLNYDCCGLDSSVDRDGVTTTYVYDPLHRQIGTIRNNITTTNLLDAAGNVLKTVRVGSDGSTNLLRSASYDTAGQLLTETNALGGVTSHARAFDGSGQTVVTTTFPDNGQRVETRYQDGSLKSVTGNAAFPVAYDYGAYANGTFTKETKGSSGGPEWVKTYSDLLGRSWKTEYADGAASTNFYNTKGQLERSVDPDGVTRLYTYNGLGQVDKTILDLNRNGAGTDSVDRITRSTNDVVEYYGSAARRSRVYQTADNGSEVLASERLVIPGLNQSISLNYGLGTTNLTTHYPWAQQRYVTITQPGGSYTVTLYTNGVLASVTRYDSLNNPLSSLNYSYDSHGRQYQVIDARNGATTYYHNAADQVSGVVTPIPATGQSAQVTTNYFDTSGRVWKTTLPDGTSVTNEFYVSGQLKKNTGSRVYPTQHTQDDQGRSETLTTWQNFAAGTGSAVTTWNYDSQRGLLSSKRYADGTGPNYTNTAAGRLKNRLWARNLNTSYTYNNAGDLNHVSYTDGTASVATGFDRRGRATSITNGSEICSMLLNDAGQMLSESCSGGPLNGLSVTNGYDELLRRTNLTLNTQLSTLNRVAYGYDSASRLQSVAALDSGLSPLVSAGYSYLADSALVSEIHYTNNGTLRMTRSNQFDNLNRLTNLVWNVGGSNVASFAYQYNSANQRTRATLADGSYWLYQYDALGQVTSAKKYWSDDTPVAGQQSTFSFDDIGNRKVTTGGGDLTGANLRSANYSANALNQITSRDVPGYVNILGTATNTATVSLWSKESTALYTPTSRRGEYFRGEMPFNNSTGAVWLTITNVAALSNFAGADIITNTVGKVFVPKTAETFSYDLDGNLTNDGRWSYTWDAENRVTSFTRKSAAPTGSRVRLDCQYDSKSRRTQKIVSTWNSTTLNYQPSTTNRYVYDGWNLIAILDATNGLVQSFTWGTDASGTMQAAGGVGGLISMTVHQGTNSGTYYYCFDGNHNVAMLVNAANGAIAAVYEYNAFLGILRATGPLASANPFVGSAKFCDWETGFLYYGYRYYDPDTGRWFSRDPIEEKGGQNLLYGFIGNNSISRVDPLGLITFEGCTGAQQDDLKKAFDSFCDKVKKCTWGVCIDDSVIRQGVREKCEANSLHIVCHQSNDGRCREDRCGYTDGWVLTFNGNTIHLCPQAWDPILCDNVGCTIIHEMTHTVGVGGTRGEHYPQRAAACLGCETEDEQDISQAMERARCKCKG